MPLPSTALTFHLDASDTDHIWTTYEGSSPYHSGVPSNSDVIEVWEDDDDKDIAAIFGADPAEAPSWHSSTPLMQLPCLDFDGVDDLYGVYDRSKSTNKFASDVISDFAFVVVAAVRIRDGATNESNPWENEAIVSDNGSFWGIHVKNDAGAFSLVFYNHDGSSNSISLSVSNNTDYVIAFWHTGGFIFAEVYDSNGLVDSGSVASGNTSDLSGPLIIGRGDGNFNGRIGELAFYNNHDDMDRANAVSYFINKWIPAGGPVGDAWDIGAFELVAGPPASPPGTGWEIGAYELIAGPPASPPGTGWDIGAFEFVEAVTVGIGLTSETDLAQAITKVKKRTLGLNSETDLAQPLAARLKKKTLGLNTETDFAQPVFGPKIVILGLATETDLAQSVTRPKIKLLGLSSEIDLAGSIARSKRKTLGLNSETDLARTMVSPKRKILGLAAEVDLARSLFRSASPDLPPFAQSLGRGRTPLFLLDIELDSGTERVSSKQVNSPSYTYEPFIVSWGVFENAIPSPVGLPITGDAKFKLAESQTRKWRNLFSHQTPRRRKVKLWALFEGESLTYRQLSPLEERVPFFTGEIVDAVFNPDLSIEITCRDMTYAWIDEPIPAMIIKEIYPDLLERYEGQFLSIVAGEVRTPELPLVSPPAVPKNRRGQIALPRMGWNDETGDRWGVAAHPCARIAVYRKVELAVDGDETEEWELVNSGEYTEVINPVNAFNIQMYHHLIDFFVEQPDGTELRADIDGYDFRGGWGDLPPIGTFESPPETTSSPPGAALQNPIDFFISMTFFVMKKAGVSTDVFDTEDISAVWLKFEDLGIKCNGAITKPMTCREWLEQFLKSFNLDMWQKRNGKISLAFVDQENPGRTVYTEKDIIAKNSFSERIIEKPYNQFQYRYLYNYAEDQYGAWGIFNTPEQDVLAIGSEPKVEKEVLDLLYVRDLATALAVTEHRSQYLSLGSNTVTWQVPLPEVPADLELASLVGVTHRMGLETGGYVNREVKVLKQRHDLDKLMSTINGVLRIPQTITIPDL